MTDDRRWTPHGGLAQARSVEDVVTVLGSCRQVATSPDPLVGPDLLDHSLQTAAVLAAEDPQDSGLQIAGLLHDIGHVLAPGEDARHGQLAGDFVEPVVGARIAQLIRLHVPAKRYLITTDPRYQLAPDSTLSLGVQGGAMERVELSAFEATDWAQEALRLRRADEAGKVDGQQVPDLDSWVPLLRLVASERVHQ
jgi:predicted HD phosphohydrolase